MVWKRIQSSTFVLMAVIILSKITGIARDIVLANCFGTSATSDAYLIAVSVPTILFFFIGNALTTTYQPMYNRIKCEEGEEEANCYSNKLMGAALVFAGIIVSLIFAFPHLVVKVFAVGFDETTVQLAVDFIRCNAFSLFFMVAVSVWSGFLHTQKNYIVPAAISFPRNAAIIISILIASQGYISALGTGLVVAYMAEMLLLIPFVLRSGYKVRIQVDFKDPRLQETLYIVLPVFLGVGVSRFNKIIDRSIASTLVEGGISALNYASVINNGVQEVAVTGIITVLFANCAALVAKGQHQEVQRRLVGTIDMMFFVLAPLSLGIIVLAKPIVTVILCRGSFNQESIVMTTSALQAYTIGLCFLAVRDTLVKVFYAYKDTRTTTATSVGAICVNVILNFLLSKVLGLKGLALATSVATIIQAVALFVLFSRKYQNLMDRYLIIGIMQTAIASLIMALIVYLLYNHWLPNAVGMLGRTAICTLAGGLVYLFICAFLNLKRLKRIVNAIFN